jgi:hypothetical protein
MHYWLLLFTLLVASCSSPEEKQRKENLRGEYIYRHHEECFFHLLPPQLQTRAPYPWEDKYVGGLPRITKEFFRCKGNPINPVVIQAIQGKDPLKYFDCQGGRAHGLPLREDKEFIYPCLIEILNYIQEKTSHRVMITCGHRCPKHNAYSDPSPSNWSSKHMLGAEVDFYVETLEQEPERIIALIQQFYAETDPQFHRFPTEKLNISTQPWYNKELFIKLYLEQEGRDWDNQHPYPYIGIQVRTDRDTHTKVTFDQKQAQNYLRH